ncbi:MAG TPA: hypothetical protein VD816_18990, partial [Ohtaekwangia sp.]|nr:hypothetical protein [Ohtaekwangia sp.]
MARFYRFFFIFGTILSQLPDVLAQDLAHSRISSYYTFIYRISNDQAERLYADMWNLENSYLKNLHDFYPTDSTYQKKLPIGHYLFISSNEGSLRGELHSVDNVDIKILNNQRDLVMIFYDSSGREISGADVTIKRKKIPYHAQTKTYRLKKSNRRGLVAVNYAGHCAYFEIERHYNSNFFVRTGRKIIGTFPFNHIASPVFYLKNNIQSIINGGGISAPGFYYRLSGIFKPKPQTGYVAFNKPQYKPGDTVRVKAYVTSRKGKPFNKDVVVNLNKYYPNGFSRKLTSVKPFRKGAYKFDFVLVDSMKLQLDNSYTVELVDKKRRQLISGSFQYEDYSLKSNSYSVRSENAENGKPTALYLKGTDSNDMPLFDVRIEILLKPSSVKAYYDRKIFIPDTLWFHETKLESIDETKVVIPETVMPDVAMAYDAVVSFLNSENERVVKQVTLSFDREKLPVTFDLQNDTLRINADKMLGCREIRLEMNSSEGKQSKMITLPHVEKLNYFATQYSIVCGDKVSYIQIGGKPDQLQVLASRTRDSLFIGTENPRKIALRFYLFRNKKLILTGEGQQIAIKRSAGAADHYNLSVQYVWAGESQSQEFNIPFDKKNLAITIEHPPLVYPGQTTTFVISVTDALGKPVQDVDLTAYAISKKFISQHVPAVPDLAKQPKQRVVLNAFNTQRIDNDILKRLDYAYWRQTLGLDSLAFYKFLFPDGGYFEERTVSAITQFAPFVIRYADIDPVIVIYVDGQPVYYRDVETIQPYSFAIKPGRHTIELRMRNALLTVHDMCIDSAQKLIFSVDRHKLPAHCTLVEMPDKLTEDELKKLGRYFITVKADVHNKNIYIRQADRYHLFGLIPRSYSTQHYLAGPFYPGKATYVEKDAFSLAFDYEPYYNYEFKEGLLKLREFDFNKSFKGDFRWYGATRPSFQDEVLTGARIKEHWENNRPLAKYSFDRFPDFMPRSTGVGKLTLDYPHESIDQSFIKVTFIVNLDHPDEYYIFPQLIKTERFNAGRYQALIILNDERYLRADAIVVDPFGTNYHDISGYKLHAADSLSRSVIDMVRQWSSRESYIMRDREMELQRLRSLYYQETSASILFTHVVAGRVTD